MTNMVIAAFGGLCIIVTLISTPRMPIAQDKLTEIEISALALEIYIQDKKDHDKYCPTKKWSQPALDIYKETLRSHLPKGCKK